MKPQIGLIAALVAILLSIALAFTGATGAKQTPDWLMSFALGGLMVTIGIFGLSKIRWFWGRLNRRTYDSYWIDRVWGAIFAISTAFMAFAFAGLFSMFLLRGLATYGEWISFWTNQATGFDPSWILTPLAYLTTACVAIQQIFYPPRRQ